MGKPTPGQIRQPLLEHLQFAAGAWCPKAANREVWSSPAPQPLPCCQHGPILTLSRERQFADALSAMSYDNPVHRAMPRRRRTSALAAAPQGQDPDVGGKGHTYEEEAFHSTRPIFDPEAGQTFADALSTMNW